MTYNAWDVNPLLTQISDSGLETLAQKICELPQDCDQEVVQETSAHKQQTFSIVVGTAESKYTANQKIRHPTVC